MRPNTEGVKSAMVIKREKMVQDRERAELFWQSNHRQRGRLEILGNARIPLPGIDTRVFNARVAARLDIPYHWLVGIIAICSVRTHLAVVRILSVVTSGRVRSRHVALFRRLGSVGGRVGRRRIRGTTMNIAIAVVSGHGSGTQHANGFNLTRVWASTV
ncbi:uncharacterized protein N7498_010144 [Penicillium cinerascens]|uniref:Uncharacterized protein n=1 Tax=Penicillium cinerascens TaxID=70096 RepID=A0A9W9J5Y4_9EURO|nr:uncharacterized protein N7498_010144 [Penicillium cinerascens]KAJ5191159.1 hypothetical protein N7498_010144 [Penicillium cinerascens]